MVDILPIVLSNGLCGLNRGWQLSTFPVYVIKGAGLRAGAAEEPGSHGGHSRGAGGAVREQEEARGVRRTAVLGHCRCDALWATNGFKWCQCQAHCTRSVAIAGIKLLHGGIYTRRLIDFNAAFSGGLALLC